MKSIVAETRRGTLDAFPFCVALLRCYFFFAAFLVAFFAAGFLAAFLVAMVSILPIRVLQQQMLQLANV
ncbi:MAG TPA: hypothetical protein VHB45_12250 [Alloacidobacterium sp.]|nr:hypothetical protein [Alloacidobacterium sp.]